MWQDKRARGGVGVGVAPAGIFAPRPMGRRGAESGISLNFPDNPRGAPPTARQSPTPQPYATVRSEGLGVDGRIAFVAADHYAGRPSPLPSQPTRPPYRACAVGCSPALDRRPQHRPPGPSLAGIGHKGAVTGRMCCALRPLRQARSRTTPGAPQNRHCGQGRIYRSGGLRPPVHAPASAWPRAAPLAIVLVAEGARPAGRLNPAPGPLARPLRALRAAAGAAGVDPPVRPR